MIVKRKIGRRGEDGDEVDSEIRLHNRMSGQVKEMHKNVITLPDSLTHTVVFCWKDSASFQEKTLGD